MEGIGIGESDFKMLRLNDYYFIDKSLYIKDIIDNNSIKNLSEYLSRYFDKKYCCFWMNMMCLYKMHM